MRKTVSGTLYAIAAFTTWGILPIYWKVLQHVPAPEILAYRIFGTFVLVSIVLAANGGWKQVIRTLAVPNLRRGLLLSTLLISVNWFFYIWAVNANHMLETSLGYYINPLLSVALGVFVLHEALTVWQRVAIGLAALGVLVITVNYGHFPWLAITIACSFALYGLVKKMLPVDSLIALNIETLFVSPLCVGYLIMKQAQGTGALGHSSALATSLLLLAGAVTALPLWWFAQAVKFIPLSRVGFIQYITPTSFLLLGVLKYHEPFTRAHLLSFACIWLALAIYSLSQTRRTNA